MRIKVRLGFLKVFSVMWSISCTLNLPCARGGFGTRPRTPRPLLQPTCRARLLQTSGLQPPIPLTTGFCRRCSVPPTGGLGSARGLAASQGRSTLRMPNSAGSTLQVEMPKNEVFMTAMPILRCLCSSRDLHVHIMLQEVPDSQMSRSPPRSASNASELLSFATGGMTPPGVSSHNRTLHFQPVECLRSDPDTEGSLSQVVYSIPGSCASAATFMWVSMPLGGLSKKLHMQAMCVYSHLRIMARLPEGRHFDSGGPSPAH